MKTVIERVREVYGENTHWAGPRWRKRLEQFAELVRKDAIADEREACAVIAETAADYLQNSTFEGVAEAIRSRSSEH